MDSTNNYALGQIRADLAEEGTCYFAHLQTAGKGQRGRQWESEYGSNIMMTVVLQPAFLTALQPFHLSACIAVAVHHFAATYDNANIKIKWPNDIYWNDQKLGGILIENIIGTDEERGKNHLTGKGIPVSKPVLKWSAVGIGLNVNQVEFAAGVRNPVSLRQITGQNFEPVQLARELCICLDKFYRRLQANDFESMFELYNQALYKKGELVEFKKGNEFFEAVIKSVNHEGQLLLHHPVNEWINFGEVEWQFSNH